MESANLYDHNNHHHHQLLYTSSSPSSLGVSALHDWKWNNNPSSSVILYGYDEALKKYMTEILPNSIKSSSTTTTTTTLQEIQFENDEMNYNFLKLNDDVMMNSYGDDDDKLSLFLGGGNYSSNTFTIPKQINNGESFGYSNNYKMEGCNKYQSFEETNSFNHFFQLQQSTTHIPSTTSNKTSKFRNGNQKLSAAAAAAADSNHQQIVVTKRPRLSSSPTLKVRKEKLGDRIAAIHRMVSPFGKTDTASVLTEAIGYIQFLQDQIQTLTMSYLKSSRSKSRRKARGDSTMKDDHHHNQHQKLEDDQKTYQDLRSRGLCLVPLSFTSYICSYSGNI